MPRKKINYAELEGPSPGTLPKKGADMLRSTFRGAVEQYYEREGKPLAEAERLASRVAWTQVKRSYYKDRKTKKWKKRKKPLRQDQYPPGSAPKEFYEGRSARAANKVQFDQSGDVLTSLHDVTLANGTVGIVQVIESPVEDGYYWVVFTPRRGSGSFLVTEVESRARARSVARKLGELGYAPLKWARASEPGAPRRLRDLDHRVWFSCDLLEFAVTCDGLVGGTFEIHRHGSDYHAMFAYDVSDEGHSLYSIGTFGSLDEAKMAANFTRAYPEIIAERVANPCFGLHLHADEVPPVLERMDGGGVSFHLDSDPRTENAMHPMHYDMTRDEIHNEVSRQMNGRRANQTTEVIYAKQIVDAANAYSAALRKEYEAFDRGSPAEMQMAQEESAAARKRLRALIGGQRQLYGGLFGGAAGASAGAALGTLALGPVPGAAIGSLAGAVLGQYLLRPRSLPEEAREDLSRGVSTGAYASRPSRPSRPARAMNPPDVAHYEVYVVSPDGVFLVGTAEETLAFDDVVDGITYCTAAQHDMDSEGNPEQARHDLVMVDGSGNVEGLAFSTAPDGYSKRGQKDREKGHGRTFEGQASAAFVFATRKDLNMATAAIDAAMERDRTTVMAANFQVFGAPTRESRDLAAALDAPDVETVLFLSGGKSEIKAARKAVDAVVGSSKGRDKDWHVVDLNVNERASNGRRRNPVKKSPALSALYAFLMSTVGAIVGLFLFLPFGVVGGLLGGPTGATIAGGLGASGGALGGSIIGARQGARLGAPEAQRDDAGYYGALGGIVGPLGGAVGAGLGSMPGEPDKRELAGAKPKKKSNGRKRKGRRR